MAYDDRNQRRDRFWGRETAWRGDQGFGGGWGNQTARADPYYEGQRGGYDGEIAPGRGYSFGYDPEYGGRPRFERGDVGTHGVHPATSIGGPDYRIGPGGSFASSARDFAIRRHDPHYAEWRERQIDALDRDYDEYRRENQASFDREFGAWRETRGRQREALGKVKEHMEVVGSDGQHVGTVDHAGNDSIILTKSDESAGGLHHRIPCAWVEKVDDKVSLNVGAAEAMERWRVEDRNRALFERERSAERGPHILNRSFAGTYSDES